ncbi:MAG: flagellar hook-length control protein FliK [Tepidiformaceae bacterium]
MGLVIQTAPADSPLAPLASPKSAESATEGDKQGDVFAALLANLSGGAPASEAASTASTLPGTLPEESGAKPDEAGTETPAVIAAMQLLAQLNPILPGPVNGGQNAAAVVAVVAPPMEADSQFSLPTEVGAAVAGSPDLAPTETPPQPQAVVEAAAPALISPGAAPASAQAGQPTASEQPVPTAALETLEAGVHAAAGKAHDKAEGLKPKDEAVAAAPEAPPNSTEPHISVVRSAGNAEQKGQTDGHANPGASGEEKNPQPNASAQGIAHAAPNSAVGQLRVSETAVPDAPQVATTETPLPEAVAHVGEAIVQKVELGGGEARLTLRPEALGEVVLHIRTDGDRVRVEIHAERAEAANLLRDHTQDLAQLLGQRGLNLTNVYVGLGGHGSNNQQDGLPAWARPREQADGSFASLMGIEEPSAADRSNRLRSVYNPDGAMSYRV